MLEHSCKVLQCGIILALSCESKGVGHHIKSKGVGHHIKIGTPSFAMPRVCQTTAQMHHRNTCPCLCAELDAARECRVHRSKICPAAPAGRPAAREPEDAAGGRAHLGHRRRCLRAAAPRTHTPGSPQTGLHSILLAGMQAGLVLSNRSVCWRESVEVSESSTKGSFASSADAVHRSRSSAGPSCSKLSTTRARIDEM